MAPNSDHEEVSLEGFGGVLQDPTPGYMVHQPTLCNQSLRLASQPVGSMPENGLDSSAAAGILIPGTDVQDGRTNSSNPKANYSKKKNGCHLGQGVKKQRLVWTQELHQFFLEIYNRSPNEKIVPKKMLEQMRERYPYITRENVASHLQKHRLYLRKLKNKELGISAKSSSKSAPVKVTTSESSYSNSTSGNSQLLPQSHSISSSPNANPQLISDPQTQNPIIPSEAMLNHEVILHFDHQTHLSGQKVMQQHPNSLNILHHADQSNNVHARRGTTNIYSNMVNNVSEIQESYNHAAYCGPIIGQPLNSATRDFSVSINLHPPTNNHIASFLDVNGNGSGNNGLNPLMGNSTAEALKHNNSNDNYFLGTDRPNFGIGDHNHRNMKYVHLDQLDGLNMCYVGTHSDALGDFVNQKDIEFHSILYPPDTHLNNAPTLSQTFANSRMAELSNFAAMNNCFQVSSERLMELTFTRCLGEVMDVYIYVLESPSKLH